MDVVSEYAADQPGAVTGTLKRCPCEWLWPPAGWRHLTACPKRPEGEGEEEE